ncbi:MAG: hypothetical protein R2860_00905 [Desulfobacterales bacterium]
MDSGGVWNEVASEIQVVGDNVREWKVDDFVPATGSSIRSNMFRWP